ncbi:hypothetical protein K439DRAFT_1621942 [Ramaria rubella]|nr:hypothetical protein K439DRAFT_1621942 [Ramaria rubella]
MPQWLALQFDQETFFTYEGMDGLANDLGKKLVDGGIQHGTLITLEVDKLVAATFHWTSIIPPSADYHLSRADDNATYHQGTSLPTDLDHHHCSHEETFPPAAKPVGHAGRDDLSCPVHKRFNWNTKRCHPDQRIYHREHHRLPGPHWTGKGLCAAVLELYVRFQCLGGFDEGTFGVNMTWGLEAVSGLE